MKKIISLLLVVTSTFFASCGKNNLQAEVDRLKSAYEEALKENESQKELVDKITEENSYLEDLINYKEEDLKQKDEEIKSIHELTLVNDEKTKIELLDYQFGFLCDENDERITEYSNFTDYLWEGDNGKPYKTTTCLTEFTDWEDAYYLVYIDDLTYQEVLKRGKANGEAMFNSPGRFPFTPYDDEYTIDGKYFYIFQRFKKWVDQMLVLKTHCLRAIRYYISGSSYSIVANNYRLVFCARRKQMTIKENIITGEIINKTINLYARENLQFSFENSPRLDTPFLDKDDSTEPSPASLEEYYFHVGEAIGVYRNEFFSQSYANLPLIYKLDDSKESYLFFTTSIRTMSVSGKKYCVIEPYEKGSYEEQLKEFYVQDVESYFRGREVTLSLYDYEKIVDFIKKNSKYEV